MLHSGNGRRMIRYNKEMLEELIPEHMQGAVTRWLENGLEPGSFLSAVLRNDLKGAVAHADSINLPRLKDYINFFYNFAPGNCWGSVEKFENWMEMHQEAFEEEQKTKS